MITLLRPIVYVHSHMCLSLLLIVVGLCDRYYYYCTCISHVSYTHTDVIVDLFINSSTHTCVSVAFALFF